MKNKKQNKTVKTVTIDVDTIERTEKYAKHYNLSFSAVVRIALIDFLDNKGN